MKKYRLQDLVSNGSRARREVQSDVLVGDPSNGYGYGDILDANATSQLIKQSILDSSSIVTGDIGQDLNDLHDKDAELTNQITVIEQRVNSITASLVGDGHIVISFP